MVSPASPRGCCLRHRDLSPVAAVENGKGKAFRWRSGLERMVEWWDGSAEDLMRATTQANTESRHNSNGIGKSLDHRANLHAQVAMRDLMAQK